jgi:hypothetical protein
VATTAETTGDYVMTRTLDRTLAVVFAVLLLYGAYAMTTGWNHTILDQYGFRQAQTAITIEYLLKGGPWFAYQTPVLGPPWPIPLEFPVYQWVVACIVYLFHVPIDQTGRAISVAFFYASLPPAYWLLRRFGMSMSQRLSFLILIVVSPLYIFWSRTVMIESCALFFSVSYLALAVEYLKSPRTSVAALMVLAGSLAAMVKLPTFFGFAICSAFLLIADMDPRALRNRTVPHLTFAACAGLVPALAGYGWSLYAERQRLLNPLAGFLGLDALREFTYGTTRQRISPDVWSVLWSRSVPDLLGSHLLILPLLICLPLVAKKYRAFSILSTAVFIIVWMTFTNLHFVHSYYQYANGLFLIAALGFGIAGLIELPGATRVSGLLLLGVAVALSLNHYRSTYERSQQLNNTGFQGIADAIRHHSKPDDVVMIYGLDWSPELPYTSGRRSIMVGDHNPLESQQARKALANLADGKLGAMVVCLSARNDEVAVKRSICSYGFEAAPKYEDAICSLYLPSPLRPTPAPCAEPGPADESNAPLANVETPRAGSMVSSAVTVGGWAISKSENHEIGVYVDDRSVRTTMTVGIARPDVQKAYPQYADSLHAGFHGTVDLTEATAGPHTLRVELSAPNGIRYRLADIPVVLVR